MDTTPGRWSHDPDPTDTALEAYWGLSGDLPIWGSATPRTTTNVVAAFGQRFTMSRIVSITYRDYDDERFLPGRRHFLVAGTDPLAPFETFAQTQPNIIRCVDINDRFLYDPGGRICLAAWRAGFVKVAMQRSARRQRASVSYPGSTPLR